MMFIRAKMDAYLDPSAGKLDTIAAEPLRTWKVTGTDEAIEAFRVAVGGVVLPDEDIVAVKTAEEVAVKIAEKTEQVATLKASLDAATTELTDLQKVTTAAVQIQTVSSKTVVGG